MIILNHTSRAGKRITVEYLEVIIHLVYVSAVGSIDDTIICCDALNPIYVVLQTIRLYYDPWRFFYKLCYF